MTLVLRGGAHAFEPGAVTRKAENSRQAIGLLGISSVAVWEDENLMDVWQASDVLANRSTVWSGDVEQLEDAGFTVVQTGKDPRHHTIVLPELSTTTLETLSALM